jgi:hypothetical protein
MVPVASWVRVWSIARPISAPGSAVPLRRWEWMSFWVTFSAMGFSGSAVASTGKGRCEACAGRRHGFAPEPGVARPVDETR